jgi:alpha-galactosidase
MKKINILLLTLAVLFSCQTSHAQNTSDFRSWAKTPPMGWNSYNSFGANVWEADVRANADFMAANLKQVGWQYIVVDFCWFYPHHIKSTASNTPQFRLKDGSYVPWLAMDEYGRLSPDQNKFKSAKDGNGFKALADYIHSKGLKFGIHIMRGIPRQAVWDKSPIKGAPGIDASMIADTTSTCKWLNSMYGVDMSKPGAQEYYNSLFELYASWGVDFIKMDDISGEGVPYYAKEVEAARKAIDKCGRPIVLSLSLYMKLPEKEHLKENANMWRVSPDFWDEWKKVDEMFELADKWQNEKQIGNWPDLDMLQLGVIARRGPVGKERTTKFTPDEQKTHFSLWAIAKSPLMMGGDLTVSSPATIEILKNKEIININQLGVNARQAMRDEKMAIWTSENPIAKSKYVAVFNLSKNTEVFNVDLKTINIKATKTIRDLWLHKDLGKCPKTLKMEIPSHGCIVYELK